VIVANHRQIREALARDLEFGIAPVNGKRIAEVDEAFVLGMDRGAVLVSEREALYRALAEVDLDKLKEAISEGIAKRLESISEIDAVDGFARPIAAQTARLLFGVGPKDDRLFMEVARAIFAHTFLNLSNDEKVRQRAIRASQLMEEWLRSEIDLRRASGKLGSDMMGALMKENLLGDDGTKRTLGGMLVGAIDTTASSVAKILAVLGSDRKLLAKVEDNADDPDVIRGWCWEALRCWPHNPIVIRSALSSTTLDGVRIEAGDRLFLWTQAAMQDASVFPDPKRLRPDRDPCHYMHFGGALHVCAGRSINAFQIPMLVGALVRRGIASVGKMSWAGPFPDHLPVKFES